MGVLNVQRCKIRESLYDILEKYRLDYIQKYGSDRRIRYYILDQEVRYSKFIEYHMNILSKEFS